MERSKIFEKVRDIICDGIGSEFDEVKEDSLLHDDLGFDSLDDVEVLIEVELEFNISIPDEEAEKFNKVSSIVDYIEKVL